MARGPPRSSSGCVFLSTRRWSQLGLGCPRVSRPRSRGLLGDVDRLRIACGKWLLTYVPPVGIEPTLVGLKVRCLTTWPQGRDRPRYRSGRATPATLGVGQAVGFGAVRPVAGRAVGRPLGGCR